MRKSDLVLSILLVGTLIVISLFLFWWTFVRENPVERRIFITLKNQ